MLIQFSHKSTINCYDYSGTDSSIAVITVKVTVNNGFGTYIYEANRSFSIVLTNLLRLPAAVNKRSLACSTVITLYQRMNVRSG